MGKLEAVDTDIISQAILDCPVSPLARETAAGLVDEWIRQFGASDAQDETVAVEAPFDVRLLGPTVVIGIRDRMVRQEGHIVTQEWKTTAAPSRYWNEARWLETMGRSPQLPIMALFAWKEGNGLPVYVQVRAAVKTQPPQFWPSQPEDGIFAYNEASLVSIENALLVKAAQIRAARVSGKVPWQWTGKQCFDWGRECAFLREYCLPKQHPTERIGERVFTGHADPLKLIPPEVLADPDLVILSATSYERASRCMELYRIVNLGGQEDESIELQIGTAAHVGWAAFYNQLKGE